MNAVRTPHSTDRADCIAEWLQAGVDAHRADDTASAEGFYRDILTLDPTHPDALHFLGVLRHQQGDGEAAIELIGRALQRAPRHADIHNNLGNIHKERGDAVIAEACYRRALAFRPGDVHATGNLGVVLELQGRVADAFDTYSLLLSLAPEHAQAHHRMGLFLRTHARDATQCRIAALCLRKAWELDHDNIAALESAGVLFYLLGEHAVAQGIYRDWLTREPASLRARHMLAACGGTPAPERAADAFVRESFDAFASSFDEQLLHKLDYRAPQLLHDALAIALQGRRDMDVLDAGCGTGLCGSLLRPWARRLDGVDLSPGMLERARLRGDYEALVEAELTAHLEAASGAFDLVVSADTLVYFGDLHRVLAAAATALRSDGRLGFTVEALESDGFDLGPSGRYRHGRAHVVAALQAAGFVDIAIDARQLRKEAGAPVHGWVVTARRGG